MNVCRASKRLRDGISSNGQNPRLRKQRNETTNVGVMESQAKLNIRVIAQDFVYAVPGMIAQESGPRRRYAQLDLLISDECHSASRWRANVVKVKHSTELGKSGGLRSRVTLRMDLNLHRGLAAHVIEKVRHHSDAAFQLEP